MDYELSELEEIYKIKLDDTQLSVLSSLIDFIESDKHIITLCGYPGTGKTTLLKILYSIISDNGYCTCCVAPTNKAKSIFNDGQFTETIHSILNLRPDLDILEFDASKLQFDLFNIPPRTFSYDVLIIDECSMINSSLYDLLVQKYKKQKIIFSGDPKQLACIEDNRLSKTFDNEKLYLDKVYRQSDSIVTKVIQYLRNKPLQRFKNVSDEYGSITVFNNIHQMIDQYGYLFKLSGDFQSTNLAKLITYSNNRISALNQLIRSRIYSDNEEYHEREILTAYDTYRQNTRIILENSVDYFVKSYRKCIIHGKYLGYALLLGTSEGNNINVNILSRKNPSYYFEELAMELEELRLKAHKSKKRSDWKNFYNLYESFTTPIDLVYNGRVIKRKTLDYGYCISAYKSQGSGYQIVLIDMENIYRFAKGEKLRQLQYVACSRTTSDLIIYQKDDYPKS